MDHLGVDNVKGSGFSYRFKKKLMKMIVKLQLD